MVVSSDHEWTDVQELIALVAHLSMDVRTCIEELDIWVELSVMGYNSVKAKVKFLVACI